MRNATGALCAEHTCVVYRLPKERIVLGRWPIKARDASGE